jgi:hypothetical protein
LIRDFAPEDFNAGLSLFELSFLPHTHL